MQDQDQVALVTNETKQLAINALADQNKARFAVLQQTLGSFESQDFYQTHVRVKGSGPTVYAQVLNKQPSKKYPGKFGGTEFETQGVLLVIIGFCEKDQPINVRSQLIPVEGAKFSKEKMESISFGDSLLNPMEQVVVDEQYFYRIEIGRKLFLSFSPASLTSIEDSMFVKCSSLQVTMSETKGRLFVNLKAEAIAQLPLEYENRAQWFVDVCYPSQPQIITPKKLEFIAEKVHSFKSKQKELAQKQKDEQNKNNDASNVPQDQQQQPLQPGQPIIELPPSTPTSNEAARNLASGNSTAPATAAKAKAKPSLFEGSNYTIIKPSSKIDLEISEEEVAELDEEEKKKYIKEKKDAANQTKFTGFLHDKCQLFVAPDPTEHLTDLKFMENYKKSWYFEKKDNGKVVEVQNCMNSNGLVYIDDPKESLCVYEASLCAYEDVLFQIFGLPKKNPDARFLWVEHGPVWWTRMRAVLNVSLQVIPTAELRESKRQNGSKGSISLALAGAFIDYNHLFSVYLEISKELAFKCMNMNPNSIPPMTDTHKIPTCFVLNPFDSTNPWKIEMAVAKRFYVVWFGQNEEAFYKALKEDLKADPKEVERLLVGNPQARRASKLFVRERLRNPNYVIMAVTIDGTLPYFDNPMPSNKKFDDDEENQGQAKPELEVTEMAEDYGQPGVDELPDYHSSQEEKRKHEEQEEEPSFSVGNVGEPNAKSDGEEELKTDAQVDPIEDDDEEEETKPKRKTSPSHSKDSKKKKPKTNHK